MPILEKFVQYAAVDGDGDRTNTSYGEVGAEDNASAFHQESIARIMNGDEGIMLLNGTDE